jgi:glycine betaine/proline transport system permease protein
MQTMPSFVYLIPAIYFLGLGKVPAVMATMIYAMPPAMRMTNLGIRLVSQDLVEAARSFGTTPLQMLIKIQLPMARPTIMAGVNQTIMMALAMVVVASMVGARGLGYDILSGIQNLEFGTGLMAGFAIVILAVVIDRIAQGFARDPRNKSGS